MLVAISACIDVFVMHCELLTVGFRLNDSRGFHGSNASRNQTSTKAGKRMLLSVFLHPPVGRTYLEVKVLYSVDRGRVTELDCKGVAADCESVGRRRRNAGLKNRRPPFGSV